MCSDWDKQPPTLRKPWGHRETVAMHAICGGYLHFMAALKSKVPKSEYEHVAKSIDVQFMSGYLDPDITHALETTVPPANLEAVGFLRKGLGGLDGFTRSDKNLGSPVFSTPGLFFN